MSSDRLAPTRFIRSRKPLRMVSAALAPTPAPRRDATGWAACRWLGGLCFGMALSLHPAWSATPAAPVVFTMGVGENAGDDSTYSGRWLRRIYSEAFRRLGMKIKYVAYPTARLTPMMERGEVDGETRAQNYSIAHPSLVRVDEPLFNIVFALYSAHDDLRLTRLEDLSSGTARVETRIGIEFCENALKAIVPTERLSRIPTTRQGLDKLQLKRTDYFCDIDVVVLNLLYTPAFKDAPLHKAMDISKPNPLFLFLSSKQAELAPRLAATLKKMRAEGLIDRYRLDTLRELGR